MMKENRCGVSNGSQQCDRGGQKFYFACVDFNDTDKSEDSVLYKQDDIVVFFEGLVCSFALNMQVEVDSVLERLFQNRTEKKNACKKIMEEAWKRK